MYTLVLALFSAIVVRRRSKKGLEHFGFVNLGGGAITRLRDSSDETRSDVNNASITISFHEAADPKTLRWRTFKTN